MIKYPTRSQYDDALGVPRIAFKSELLQSAKFLKVRDTHQRSTGSFAFLAKAEIENVNWAVRLLLKEQANLEVRYQEICSKLIGKCDFLVNVKYFSEEIQVEGGDQRFPLILMQWVEGVQLKDYVFDLCEREDIEGIFALRAAISDLSISMREFGIAHGDLSPENVQVLGPSSDPKLVLLDYDSMWMPWIPDLRCDVGITDLQHKSRTNPIGPHADQMAFLLIDTALDFLSKKPKTGTDLNSFDRKFLFTVDEFIEGKSTLVGDVNKACPELCEVLKSYILGPYDLWMSSGESLSGLVVRDLADEMEISSKKLLTICNQVWPGSWSSNRELTLSQIKVIKNHFAKNNSNNFAGGAVPVTSTFSEFSEANWMMAMAIEEEKLVQSGEPLVIEASEGDIDAMMNLGQLAEADSSTDRNLWFARHWYRKAAISGDVNAMLHLADLLERMGVVEEPEGARHWYRAAALTGDLTGMNNFGVFLDSIGVNPQEAVAWVKSASEGDPTNLTFLQNFENLSTKLVPAAQALNTLGLEKLRKNKFAEAEGLFREAINLSPRQIEIVLNLADSLKVQGRLKDAEPHYLRAAEAGNIRAMKCMVSLLFNDGRKYGTTGAEGWQAKLCEVETTYQNLKILARMRAGKINF